MRPDEIVDLYSPENEKAPERDVEDVRPQPHKGEKARPESRIVPIKKGNKKALSKVGKVWFAAAGTW